MKLMLKLSSSLTALAAGFTTFSFTPQLLADPCAELGLEGTLIYGSGGSAVTPVLRAVAVALATLPEEERITILYADEGGACAGYGWWRDPAETDVNFKFWDENDVQTICQAPQTATQFAHMGNTPALCPGDVPLPSGTEKFVATVQTVNFITDVASLEESISAEAAYHIFGFGPGAHNIAPWNAPLGFFGRQSSSFVAQLVGHIIGVPSTVFVIPPENIRTQNGDVVSEVASWPTPEESLGFVSGSNAQAGEYASPPTIKTLAYQHYDQDCAYLPDSSRTRPDRANVRSGQYFIWTPGWFYSEVGSDGEPVDEAVEKLIHWVDGSLAPPDGVPVQEIVIDAGDVPLCAMQAIRPQGDVSPIQSYAPSDPCNGWYEFTATGDTTYQACDTTADCDGAEQDTEGTEIGEQCRYGFCEAY